MRSRVSFPTRPIEIVSDGLFLRPIKIASLEMVAAAFADPVIALWNPRPTSEHGPIHAASEWIHAQSDWSSGTHVSWGVFADKADDENLLGSVALHQINLCQRNAELGYWVVPSARGRGVAYRAVVAATRFAFQSLDIYRLQLTHALENRASCRVAEKAGFQLEGVLRQAFIYGDNRRHDEHLHGLLRTDKRALEPLVAEPD